MEEQDEPTPQFGSDCDYVIEMVGGPCDGLKYISSMIDEEQMGKLLFVKFPQIRGLYRVRKSGEFTNRKADYEL